MLLHFCQFCATETCKFTKTGECSDATSVLIARGFTQIAEGQFRQYSNLQTVDFEDGSACVTFQKNAFDSSTKLEAIVLPQMLKTISERCFTGCRSLQSITFPPSILAIGEYVFNGCTSLTSIAFPENGTIHIGLGAFHGVPITTFDVKKSIVSVDGFLSTSIKAFTCPDDHPNFTVIDDVLFSKDAKIAVLYPASKRDDPSYVVPSSVTQIAAYCFYTYNRPIVFPADSRIDVFQENSFSNWQGSSISFPANCTLTQICLSSFTSAYAIETFVITANVKTIEPGAFRNSGIREFQVAADVTRYMVTDGVLMDDNETITVVPPNFTQYTVPAHVKTVLPYAFSFSSIKYVYFERPALIETLGMYAFAESALQFVDFDPACNIKSIGHLTFHKCPLENLTLPANVKSFTGSATRSSTLAEFTLAAGNANFAVLDGVLFSPDLKQIIAYPSGKADLSYVFPEVTERGNNYCFAGALHLQKVSFPAGSKFRELTGGFFEAATNVGIDFANATRLNDIQWWCFALNSAIANVRVPDSVTTIGLRAFYYCRSLEKVVLPASLNSLAESAFESCPKLTVIEFSPYCPLEAILDHCFSSSSVKHLVIPWRLASVASNAFADAVETLVFLSRPRVGVLEGFAGHTSLKTIYVPCECSDWSPTVQFGGGQPSVVVYCTTKSISLRRKLIALLLPSALFG